jgi:hypothetical protein
MKPLEDNTSTFFFGDEGIDTTTGFDQTFDALNPALLSTPHDMQQTLVRLHSPTHRSLLIVLIVYG